MKQLLTKNRMKKHFPFYLMLIAWSFAFSSTAANRYVSVGGSGNGLSWATAKGSIQSAIYDCSAGDTVFVSSGTYNEAFAIKDGVSVLGGYNASTGERDWQRFETILDGYGLSKYLIVKYDTDCVNPTLIEGFTLENAEHSNEGGGAYIRGNITLANSIIRNCKGSNGGGVFINGAGVVRNCVIELCSATSSGGGIRNKGGLVESCILRGNQGKYGTIRNDGGTISNCIVHNNSATVSGWPNSGGIYNPGGVVVNCILACNYGSQYAAIHSNSTAINNVCWNNQAEDGFSDPVAFISSGGSSSGYNAAESGFDASCFVLTLNANNTALDGPNFKSPTTFVGIPGSDAEIAAMRAADFSFTSASPCIDKGTATLAPAKDFLGVTRPKGTAVDLGAYEYDPDAVPVAVTGVELTVDTLRLEEEETSWLSIIITPTDATNKKVTWLSSNTIIATVSNGLVSALETGETKVIVTTEDGGFKDTCVVIVEEKSVVIVHPEVLEADELLESDYTVPSFTPFLIAKETARADSSEANLQALRASIANLVNKNMPYCVVANINGDPTSRMAFAWFTNADISTGKVQIVAKANASEADFTSPAFEITATSQAVNNLNYAVSTNGILIPANLPPGTKRSYMSHKVLATGLTAGTEYSYRVGNDGYWSEIRAFKTAKNDNSEFSFLYMTDSHIQDAEYVENARWSAITSAANASDANFVLFTGDFVETGTEQNAEWEWEQWFETSMKPLLAKMPVVPTDGNHDDSKNLNYTHHFNTNNDFKQSAVIKPQFDGTTYSFVYGDALFLIFSVQDYWRGSYSYESGTSIYLEDDVADWLRAQVTAHPDTKWRIAAVHKNLFTGSSHQDDTESVLFRATLLPVLNELDIDFVIQGHDHIYEVMGPINNLTKTVVPNSVADVVSVPVHSNKNPKGQEGGTFTVDDGTLYFVNSTSGRKRYYPYTQAQMEANYDKHQVANYWDLFTGKYGQPGAPTYSKITVSSSSIQVDSYTASSSAVATLFDSFTIVKNDIPNSISTIESENNVLFPIPAGMSVNTTIADVIGVSAVDLAGRKISLSFDKQQIDTSVLSTGMYLLHITTPRGINTYKLLKK
jgi:hypothetical protein